MQNKVHLQVRFLIFHDQFRYQFSKERALIILLILHLDRSQDLLNYEIVSNLFHPEISEFHE